MALCVSLVKFTSYLFWWLVFISVGPAFAFVFGIFWFWKFVIIQPIAKLAISKTAHRLDSFDSVLAIDDFWGSPLATIGLLLTVDGKVDISEFRQQFKETVIEAIAKDGRVIHAKLLKIPKQFCGYFFWESCHDFKIEEHITEIDCSNFANVDTNKNGKPRDCDAYLQACTSAQLKKPFPVGKPLWDVTVFSNYSDDGLSAIFFRFHHCIADGYTVVKIVDRMTGIRTIVNQSTASFGQLRTLTEGTAKERFTSWLGWVHFILRTPYVVAHLYLDNLFHSGIFTSKKTSKDFVFSWTSISLSHLRTIRQRTKARFATLGMSLLSGALRKHLEKIQSAGIKMKNDDDFRMMVPLPWPNHPSHKMTNHWTMGIAEASHSEDSLERLAATQASFTKTLTSGAPTWCRFVGPSLLALFPKSILKFVLSSHHISSGIIFTSVPGSSEKNTIKILGNHVVSMIPILGPQYMHTGIVCVIFTYDGKANCTIAGNVDIIKNQENADQICQQFLQEELTALLLASKEISSSGNGNSNGVGSPLLAHQIV